MKTISQQIKSLKILKTELNNKLIDFENGSNMITESEYNEIYNNYISVDKKIESLMAGV